MRMMAEQAPEQGKPPIPQNRFVIVLIVIGFMIIGLGAGIGVWKLASVQQGETAGSGDSQTHAVSTAAP